MLRRGNRPTLLVNRVTKTTKDGNAYLDTGKNQVYEIDAWYADGRARTTSGDTWRVQKYNGSEADYICTDAVGKR